VAEAVSEERPAESEAILIARRRAEQKVPRHRFGLAYLALAALLGAAVGLFVVLVGSGGKSDSEAWAAWKPTQTGVPRLTEIANYVAKQYALPSGRQIVGAYSSPPVVQYKSQLAQARVIQIRTGLRGETDADSQLLDAGKVWAYELCGFGTGCAVAEGKATVARGELLQREALELSLYTFKYEKAIDYVLTYFPPVPKNTPAAILLRRQDLEQALDHPLAQTLQPPRTRNVVGKLSSRDLAALDRYVLRAYTYTSGSLQDGSPLLVLTPVSG
jgi:hypothetical protein